MSKNIEFNFATLSNGEFQRNLEIEVNKVFKNIHDKQTGTSKRTVTIKLDFEPDEKRKNVTVGCNITSKMAPINTKNAVMKTEKAGDTIIARELLSGVPGQTYIDDNGEQRTDTGEPIDMAEKEMADQNKAIYLTRG